MNEAGSTWDFTPKTKKQGNGLNEVGAPASGYTALSQVHAPDKDLNTPTLDGEIDYPAQDW
jgi:hypothetical protein